MRHLIHVTRTASGNKELAVTGAVTCVRYHALEREIPDQLAEQIEAGEAVDHLRDEEWLASEVAHQGDPEIVVALGFAVGACASYARRHGASIEAVVELDLAPLDEEQRAKVDWLLTALRKACGDRVRVVAPSKIEQALGESIAQQKN